MHNQFAVAAGGTRGMGRKETDVTGGLSNVRRNRNPHSITRPGLQNAGDLTWHRLSAFRGVLLGNVNGRCWPRAVILG